MKSETLVLRGARVLREGSFLDADVQIRDGRISAVGEGLEGDVLRVCGDLVPGFLDEHIHGIAGHDTMRGAHDVLEMSRALARHGVTTFLPTTMNAGPEETNAALRGVKAAMQAGAPGADIAGAHMEGPFLGAAYPGAQKAGANLAPTWENYARLTEGAQDVVRLLTLAPENPGARGLIAALAARGVAVSAGHTDAKYEQIREAMESGLTQMTHLYNCMSPLHHRAPGAVGAALTLEGGDGTLLRGAQYALSWDAALLGVNLGRVGFLAEGEADALPKLLDKVIRGDYETERRAVLSVQMNGQSWYAINDVVMSRGGYARLITVTALVDGELAGHYIADGLVVATPTGSTGYSLSAGGPIISPKVDCMVLTPICAHSLQHRPTVVQGSAQIRLLLGSDAPQSACLQVDGQTYAQLDDGAVVEISRADRTLQLIRTSDQPFFNLVREKLTEWTR